ncbi:hypothetical protein SBADM41S_08851 [Streptomyces badius]
MSRRRIGFWYRLAAVIAKPPLVVLFKRDWRGMEHVPADGGFISVVNHNSYLDPLSYGHFQYNTGRVPRFLANASLFRTPFVGMMLRGTGQIPVYRETTNALDAFRAAVEAIEHGECVAFYPEGTLTRDPDMWPMAGKDRAAQPRTWIKAPVIPVAEWGANEVMPPYAKENKLRLFPRKTLRVQAGPPRRPQPLPRPGADARGAARGDRGHHGGGHPRAGGPARREGPRRALRSPQSPC